MYAVLQASEKRQQDLSESNVLGFRVVNFRNDLPEHLVTAHSVNIFKNRFDKHCSHLRFCSLILISKTCSRRDDDDVSMKISRQATSL